VGSHFGFRFLRFAPVATRMSKGKSVFWETLPWGDPSRHAVVRMSNGESVSRGTLSEGDPSHRVAGNGRIVGGLGPLGKMSKGKSVSRETLFWGDLFCWTLTWWRFRRGDV
jgi:hypothetical protein